MDIFCLSWAIQSQTLQFCSLSQEVDRPVLGFPWSLAPGWVLSVEETRERKESYLFPLEPPCKLLWTSCLSLWKAQLLTMLHSLLSCPCLFKPAACWQLLPLLASKDVPSLDAFPQSWHIFGKQPHPPLPNKILIFIQSLVLKCFMGNFPNLEGWMWKPTMIIPFWC